MAGLMALLTTCVTHPQEESEAADRAAAALREQQALEDMQDKAKGAAPGSVPAAAAPAPEAPADASAEASPAAEALALADFAASPGAAPPADAAPAGVEVEEQGLPGGDGLGAAGDDGGDDDGGGFEEEI